MNRDKAEAILQKVFKIFKFYDTQWQVVERILKGERVLLIEKTGFGKSLCFQFPAILFEGTTIVFTPLIALMRDQVNKLRSLGINAKCINSNQDSNSNKCIIQEAINNEIKVLYIAPERMENIEWITSAKQMKISMIVVDEAHCISTWGHDFRPSYKRIINLVNLLPSSFPLLATTATATKRVQGDIEEQLGKNLYTYRGNLIRSNFHLFVIKVESEEEKFIWLAQNIKNIEGTGIIYTGTKADTQIYAQWLQENDINSTFYNGELEPEIREDIEKGLIENRWKCIVSTNALGMGIDKPDIRFIIHTQVPISPIHYYQEIGRAGRDGKKTFVVLFYNPDEDDDLPYAFIDGSKPKIGNYYKVINALKESRLSTIELTKVTNMKRKEIDVIKADLISQNIINEVFENRKRYYELRFNAPKLDPQPFMDLREKKICEFQKIKDYIDLSNCRMSYLCNYLGDDSVENCEKCDNCMDHIVKVKLSDEWLEKFKIFNENLFPIIEQGRGNGNLIQGVASSFYGSSNVGKVIHKCKYQNGGDFPDFLVNQTLKAFHKSFKGIKFDLILYVPPTESGRLVKNFAEKISSNLKIPISHNFKKISETKPQKMFQNIYSKKENVKNVFTYTNTIELKNKVILLIDDIYDSGATIKEIGKYLTGQGALCIAPLVIAKTVGGDKI